jgi:hypothetical protein
MQNVELDRGERFRTVNNWGSNFERSFIAPLLSYGIVDDADFGAWSSELRLAGGAGV